MKNTVREIEEVQDALALAPSEIAYRRRVLSAFLLIWVALSIYTWYWFARHNALRGDALTNTAHVFPSMMLLTCAISIIYCWIRDRSSLRALWRLATQSELFLRTTFDLFKNAAVPVAAVAIIGRALHFLVRRGLPNAPAWILDSLPPGASTGDVTFITIVFYLACGILLGAAVRNAEIGFRNAAEAFAKKDNINAKSFWRKSGISAYLWCLTVIELFAFAAAFLYASLGK